NREERKCRFGAHGREFQQQTALANSPIAENRERTRSTCRQSLLQGLAERLNVLPPANKLVRSDWEIGLRTHVGPPKSQSDACQRIFVTFVTFVTFAGLHGRRHEHTPPTYRAEVEGVIWWVLLLVGGESEGVSSRFWERGRVLNEGTVDHGFRPVDP